MGDLAPKPEALRPGSEKRRSQRVLLVIPVEVSWVDGGKSRQSSAKTEVVSAHGALLRMKAPLAIGTEVELHHPITGQTNRGRVVSLDAATKESLPGVGMELEAPSKEFWGVTIPPVRGTS